MALTVPRQAAAGRASTGPSHPSGAAVPDAAPVRARPLLGVLAGGTLTLLATNVAVKVLADPPRDMTPWLRAFDVNRENNVPTVWNALLFAAVAAGCVLVAATAAARRTGWVVAALAGTAMAFDELLRLHENLRGAGSRLSGVVSISLPTYAWVLPGLVIALACGLVVAGWSRRLPRDVRRWLNLGVLLFFAGAVGAEALSGWVDVTLGVGRAYTVVTTAEEGLEMAGCIVALRGVLGMLVVVEIAGRRAVLHRP